MCRVIAGCCSGILMRAIEASPAMPQITCDNYREATLRLSRAHASAFAEDGLDTPRTASERVYGDLLAELAKRDPHEVRTRVVVDVDRGHVGEGINGVYLAKALAHNHSQEALRDLWLNHGDIQQLLRGPKRLPAALKVPVLLAQAVKKPLLKGDAIARWMYQALRDMDGARSEPAELETLLPRRDLTAGGQPTARHAPRHPRRTPPPKPGRAPRRAHTVLR